MSTKIELMDGKYTLEHNNGVGLRCLRYGEYWRDLVGDGMVLALVSEVEELREKLAQQPADDGRADFESWVSDTFDCTWCSFDKMKRLDGTTSYVYDVRIKSSIAGMVTDEKCSVEMLWQAWQRSRGAA